MNASQNKLNPSIRWRERRGRRRGWGAARPRRWSRGRRTRSCCLPRRRPALRRHRRCQHWCLPSPSARRRASRLRQKRGCRCFRCRHPIAPRRPRPQHRSRARRCSARSHASAQSARPRRPSIAR